MTARTLQAQGLTLQSALDITYRDNWQHRRDKGASLMSQAKLACGGVASVILMQAHVASDDPLAVIKVHSVMPDDVREATALWYAEGLSPATITKRLNCLSVLGVCVEGLRPPEKTALKWWLRPEEERAALNLLEGTWGDVGLAVGAFIAWTTLTGLRIEESLRLTPSSFSNDFDAVTVPGLKTATSQATLPLSTSAAEIAESRFGSLMGPPRGWELDYKRLGAAWCQLRAAMGWPPEATLKALRRSAARYLHVDCGMPLDLVRCYLRHEKLDTTLSYLRLTGGYSDAEFRKYLK